MPQDARDRFEAFLGEWATETFIGGEKKGEGEYRVEWAPGRSCLVTYFAGTDPDGRFFNTGVFAWDAGTDSVVQFASRSRGDNWALNWTDFGKDRWTGTGFSVPDGAQWESQISVAYRGKDEFVYEDITDGKTFRKIAKRKK